MLKSTKNPLSREQFTKLREARRLINQQFKTEFSLQSEHVIRDVYAFALRSDTNELFRHFSELNALSGEVAQPLNEEQFILLREANRLIKAESGEELALIDADVLDKLYAFALDSRGEELYDIYRYLCSREAQADVPASALSGAYFRKLREAKSLIGAASEQEIVLHAGVDIAALAAIAQQSDDAQSIETVDWLRNWRPGKAAMSELLFHELSAPDFERLRQAKLEIRHEIDEEFSLHSDTALDDLYGYALRSDGLVLFDLFNDLLEPQMTPRDSAKIAHDWLSNEQFTLLRSARETIRAEFGETLQLQSPTVHNDLYQFALYAADEDLYDLCWAYQQLCTPQAGDVAALPSKEEFRMLRRARSLVEKEFSEDLQLQSEDVEAQLYRYAVSSESDDLFDLYEDLMVLPSKAEVAEARRVLLCKEEFVALRDARRLIRSEFDEHLALEDDGVLDRLYEFALESEGEELFDLHSELNEMAVPASAEPETVLDEELDEEVIEEQLQAAETVLEEAAERTPLKRLLNRLGRVFHRAEAVAVERDAIQNAASEAAAAASADAPRTSFPDLVVRAVEQRPKPTPAAQAEDVGVPVLVSDVELAVPKQPISAGLKEKKPAGTPTALAATDSEKLDDNRSWYISTLDDRLRVRLSSQLSVGMDGELVVAAPSGSKACAIIDIMAGKPVIIAQAEEIFINDQPVLDKCELASGDKIAVAGTVLLVDYTGPEPGGEDQTLSAG